MTAMQWRKNIELRDECAAIAGAAVRIFLELNAALALRAMSKPEMQSERCCKVIGAGVHQTSKPKLIDLFGGLEGRPGDQPPKPQPGPFPTLYERGDWS